MGHFQYWVCFSSTQTRSCRRRNPTLPVFARYFIGSYAVDLRVLALQALHLYPSPRPFMLPPHLSCLLHAKPGTYAHVLYNSCNVIKFKLQQLSQSFDTPKPSLLLSSFQYCTLTITHLILLLLKQLTAYPPIQSQIHLVIRKLYRLQPPSNPRRVVVSH